MRLTRFFTACALALCAFAPATAQTPRRAEDFYNRGLERHGRGDFDGSIADYTQAIAADPSMAQAYANRGVVYLLQGRADSADKDFAKAFELDPSLRPAFEKYIAEVKRIRGQKP